MKLLLFILLLIIAAALALFSASVFYSIDWKASEEQILETYMLGATLTMFCIGFILLAWKAFHWWQFDVEVDEVVRDFDAYEDGEAFDIRCGTEKVAREFYRQRKRRIVGYQSFKPTHKRLQGFKVASRG